MPFCKPEEGVQKVARSVNPGTVLMGLRIENSPYTFYMMVDEAAKLVCRAPGQKGSYGKLTKHEATKLHEKIRDGYRVRLILDNLPITTYDLQRDPESVRPGFELGFISDNKYYVNNHLIFKILVHPTNGQYTRMKEEMEQLEAAAVVEGAGRKLLVPQQHMATMRRVLQQQSAGGVDKGVPSTGASAFLDAVDMEEDWLGASHLFMVVGFEVVACSIHRVPGKNPENLPCPAEGNNIKPQVVMG